ncbi:uncharacterized protein LOC135834613 isoform X2 [Planococcus citri]|uniref:uncharacterized protein LOC135834613 isoform X2 n=1 Tax=Planococcus citri TaxID=170843 RepID=UPI0031F8ACFE
MTMETACCGISLRSASLLLLYLNLIGNVWQLLTIRLNDAADTSYKQFLRDDVGFYFDIALMIIESLIFFGAILAISCSKASIFLLTVTVSCLLLDIFYLLYCMIKLSSDHNKDKLVQILTNKNSSEVHSGTIVLLFYMFLLAALAFKFYSAFMFHGYKVELKGGPVWRSTVDKDVNLYSPYGENFQYAAPLLKLALNLSK